jgi:hypothetical protein
LFIFEDAEKEDKAEGKAHAAKKKKILTIVVFSLCIFLLNLCDSRQFMILDPLSG